MTIEHVLNCDIIVQDRSEDMLEFRERIDEETYDLFASNHELASINQSAKWAKIKNNWIPYHTGLYENEKLVAVALVLLRPLPLGFKFAYVPRGPLLDFNNKDHVKAMLDGLKNLAKKTRCLFVRMDPKVSYREFKLEDKENAQPLKTGKIAIHNLVEAGARHLGFPLAMDDGFQPRFVAATSASDSFEQDLSKKVKKYVKSADKHNVVIENKTIEDLDDFIEVLNMTEDRKGIALRTKEYHELLMKTYGDDALLQFAMVDLNKNHEAFQEELASVMDEIESSQNAPKKLHLLKERQVSLEKHIEDVTPYLKHHGERKVLSGMLSLRYGHTTEHLYAGFDIEFNKYMPQYKLYVESMKECFEHGDKYVSMGGIEGTLDDGLTFFKNHFRPTIYEYIGEFDISTSVLYPLFMVAWKIRKNRSR